MGDKDEAAQMYKLLDEHQQQIEVQKVRVNHP